MENSDSTGINKFEKEKWMIEKIDQLHKSSIKSFESYANKYESKGNKAILKLKERRTIGTSALAGILSILYAINNSYPITAYNFLLF